MAVTRADVEDLAANGWNNLSDSKKDALLQDAKDEKDTLYSDRMSRLPTLEGDADVFVKNLAAHKYELAEGGQANSESSAGGSASYDTQTGEDYLDLTRYGRTAKRHVYDEQSIAIVRSY